MGKITKINLWGLDFILPSQQLKPPFMAESDLKEKDMRSF